MQVYVHGAAHTYKELLAFIHEMCRENVWATAGGAVACSAFYAGTKSDGAKHFNKWVGFLLIPVSATAPAVFAVMPTHYEVTQRLYPMLIFNSFLFVVVFCIGCGMPELMGPSLMAAAPMVTIGVIAKPASTGSWHKLFEESEQL